MSPAAELLEGGSPATIITVEEGVGIYVSIVDGDEDTVVELPSGSWASAMMEATASALTEVEGGSAVGVLVGAVGEGVVMTADVELTPASWALSGLGEAEEGTVAIELAG